LGIVQSSTASVIAYGEEADIDKLQVDGEGRFYPEGGDLSPIPVKITAVDRAGTRALKLEELASSYGGGIAVRPDEDKQLVPEQGIYRLSLQADQAGSSFTSTVRGRVSLSTEPESIAGWLMRLFVVGLVKESGW